MKLLFIDTAYESLGIEYLSGALKSAGHVTELAFEAGLSETLYFPKKKKRTHSFVLKKIKYFNPGLVMFTSTTNLFPWVKEVSSAIKEHFAVPILVGGIHPTILPEETIAHPAIDMVCRGEGDEAIVELVGKMESKNDYFNTRNFWFKTNDGIIRNPLRPLIQNLDSLSLPDKEMYKRSGFPLKRVYLQMSRGCPYRCPYCYNHQLQKLYKVHNHIYYRRRSVASVISEFQDYKKRYGSKSAYFYDNTFNYGNDWLFEFLSEYCKKVALPFSCYLRADLIDEKIVKALKKANCKWAYIGVESGNETIRRKILKRNISSEKIMDSVQILKENNIKVVTFNMFGLPGEGSEEMFDTAEMNLKMKPNAVATFTFYPFPETDLTKEAIEKGYIDSEVLEKIKNGESNWTEESILKHPYKQLAYNLKIILPLLNKMPKFMRPFFLKNWALKRHSSSLLYFLKIISLPVVHSPWETIERVKEALSVYRQSLFQFIKYFFKY